MQNKFLSLRDRLRESNFVLNKELILAAQK